MIVKEKIVAISTLTSKIIDFVNNDKQIYEEFSKYIDDLGIKITSQAQYNSLIIPFIFEAKIENKTIADLFEQNNEELYEEDKEILKGFDKSICSIFEIKRILKNGFELFNWINECSYNALTLVKMSNFRGMAAGQYIYGRIFPCDDKYYLVEINNVISSAEKEKALRFAVAKQMENSDEIFKGNDKKIQELETLVTNVNQKFKEFFGDNDVITKNIHVDELISKFNDFVEDGTTVDKAEIQTLIEKPVEYKFFHIKDFSQNGDFIEAAAKGFSSQDETYDVGIICDKELGLFVIPFYATFCNIFEVEDYKTIEGSAECVKHFLKNDKIPPSIIKKIAKQYPEKFKQISNEVLDTKGSLDKILKEYKPDYFQGKKFSSTTVLYASKAFNEIMGFIGKEKKPEYGNSVGRNEPCPCGSSKKYKKCCGK